MAIKLFVTDLDGTLLPTQATVSEGNIRAVQDAVAAGVTVTIATGRMYRAALPVAQALGVNVPIITYNGALIKTVDGNVIYRSCLEPSLVVKILDFCESRGWYVQSYSRDSLRYPEHTELSDQYEKSQLVTGEAVGWDGMREITEETPKLLCIAPRPEEAEERVKALSEHFAGRLEVFRSSPRYIELVRVGVSKAAAVTLLAERMGITKDEVMAIGDGNNDIPMLQAAGRSVAMGNAIPEVKAVCDYVTGDCLEDGFADAIYRYVLEKN